ncbi:MAG: heme lyase CcmF/NrfE family subunit [Zoogloeaceae bacterium]|jgi:c-type cytochrome biogenesis protein CcmF|nr:heme lyase CcmF/NrfE family subunit [Zoogloeaceae bacterium]
MIPETGLFALILALLLALFSGVAALTGAIKGNPVLIALARPAAGTIFLLVGIGYLCLTIAFIQNDFSVLYVARHSSTLLPLPYRIAGVWGGHEGSLLLWLLFLCLWTFAVALFSRQLPDALRAQVLGVLFLVSAGFLLFILKTSNPFLRLLPAATEGGELNPMLQDIGLIIHPPLLYMGYVGFAVAYAFAVSALISGRLDAAWARWTRPWTVASWIFLTLGIACGSWWAYYELGWGGWWFWDPVENASFMPWLIGTALIHSLAVTEKRGAFKNWTVLLAISAFSLSLLGTFLVRSGVLSSVHAFASSPDRGIFILVFLVVVIGVSLLLFVWRAPTVGLGGRFSLISRESLLLSNNVLLAIATGTVLLGTLYPLIIDALGLGKISVGSPYFNTVFVPLMFPLLFLTGIGPFTRWRKDELMEIAQHLKWLLVIAFLAAIVCQFLLEFSLDNGTFKAHYIFPILILLGVALFLATRMGRPGENLLTSLFFTLRQSTPTETGLHARRLKERLPIAFVIFCVVAIGAYWFSLDSHDQKSMGMDLKITVLFSLFLATWIFLTAVFHFLRQARATAGKNGSLIASCLKQPLHFWGMHIAHIGVAVFVAGVAVVGGYEAEKDVKMLPGDTAHIAGHTFRFLGMNQVDGPNYIAWQGEMELSESGEATQRLYPEKRFYQSSAMPMTEAAIVSGFLRDVYVSLGEPIDRAQPDKEWVVRIYYKPLVNWIWGGTYLMALGGLLAILDRRYRIRRKPPVEQPA